MQIDNNVLVNDLLRRIENCTNKVKQFESLSLEQLRFKAESQWSILECLEHLNLYGDFYLVEIEKQILASPYKAGSTKFKSGLIGNYFANLMEVKDGKIKKMKSPKDKNPSNTTLTTTTISRFLKQQERLVDLLNKCRAIDLTKTKTSISLTSFIKLRLGDTLRFYTYHIERHVLQAERVLNNVSVFEHEKVKAMNV
ncbi:DinB family protein [Chryseolinea sp. H1M3-3]|uniref:DinB family protein n=1 Tax=Chryseolinea sp. H1M3-3 TaxID=3034144 RepID=UPI0023EDEC88|nr:DinB family protein [Chryseolinea sp. H1M3-3]